MGPCPSEEEVQLFVEGALATPKAESLQQHVDECASCRDVVARVAGLYTSLRATLDEAPRPPAAPLAPGTPIGRYLLLELVGKGGMGTVWAAYDPELHRKVAIKLWRPERASGGDRDARLLREAQALAQLSHPNIVTVYDVGTSERGVFLAMELIDGCTLRGWLTETRRPWRRVLSVFLAAGRGLAAAHRAGLVHRDFKPDNVLVGNDGRVLVTDFGLARFGSAAAKEPTPASSGRVGALTATGAVLGTPAYMAPEQYDGAPVDMRTDLFAYCIALYEGLYGQHPLPLDSEAALAEALRTGRIRPPPRRAGVPLSVHRALLAGLAWDPAARPPSMDVLLARLSRDPGRTARRIAAGLVFAGALAGVIVATRGDDGACRRRADAVTSLWSQERRSAVEEAFRRTGAPYAADSFQRVDAALAAWSGRWRSAAQRACRASSAPALGCLDGRLDEASYQVDLFAAADRTLVAQAPDLAARLPGLGRCRKALAAPRPTEEGAVRRHLARAKTLRKSGRYREGLREAEAALAAARALGRPVLEVRANYLTGSLLTHLGRVAESEKVLRRSARRAYVLGDDDLVARARVRVFALMAGDRRRAEEALAFGDEAMAAIERAGKEPFRVASYFIARGDVQAGLARPEEALADYRSALAIFEGRAKPTQSRVPRTMLKAGRVLVVLGKDKDALGLFARALQLSEAALGREHPRIAEILEAEHPVLQRLGRAEEARLIALRVAELRSRLGNDRERH